MIGRMAIVATIAAMLGGCVLQSRAPRFGDSDAVLALGATGGLARMSNWRDGKWVPEDESAEIKITGMHYEAATASAWVSLHFVPLEGAWFVVQGSDRANPAAYMLAEVKQQTAELRPLACGDLKTNASAAASISFEGDDCFIKPEADAKRLFTTLLHSPGEPTSRLEIVP